MIARARYTATTVGANVILTPKATGEDEDKAGDPGVFGTGVLTITTTVAASTGFWRVGGEYVISAAKM